MADRYYITFDADGLDPSIAPGVGYPSFGGLTYYQAFDLLRGVAAKGGSLASTSWKSCQHSTFGTDEHARGPVER